MASVLYFPKLDLLIQSTKDGGTFTNGNKSKVKEYNNLENCLVAFDFSKSKETNYIISKETSKKIMRIREFGAACFGFAMVANGKIDGYCILQNTAWDIETGLLACIESGAKFYRDDICTIVANSEEIIEVVREALKIASENIN